jgi:hypothetical protein
MKIEESVTPGNLNPVMQAVSYEVHVPYEPGYVILCVGKITEEMSVYLNIPLEYEYRKYYENKIL